MTKYNVTLGFQDLQYVHKHCLVSFIVYNGSSDYFKTATNAAIWDSTYLKLKQNAGSKTCFTRPSLDLSIMAMWPSENVNEIMTGILSFSAVIKLAYPKKFYGTGFLV